jgi:tripeptide aminopeptidase
MDKIFDKFKKLVEIYSPSGGEKEIAEYLERYLNQQGFEVYEDKQKNLLARRGEKGSPVMFCAHMDTVEPSKNVRFDIHKGVVQSDGNTILGADNKASISAILEAVENMDEEQMIEILLTVKEESGGGLKTFPFTGVESDICFVFDSVSPIGTVITHSPNIINFEFDIRGQSAHISHSENGMNAMIPATYIVQAIHRIQYGEGSIVNIGQFNSGDNTNSVPGFATIKGEIRSFDENEFEQILEEISEINEKTLTKFGIHSELKILKDTRCYGYIHEKEEIAQTGILQVYKKLGIQPNLKKSWAVSDANTLNDEGIMTLNLGDGVLNAHTLNETIEVESVVKIYEIIMQILKQSK